MTLRAIRRRGDLNDFSLYSQGWRIPSPPHVTPGGPGERTPAEVFEAAVSQRPAARVYGSLVRTSSWSLLANFFYALSQWALIAALARLSNPETVGRYALAAAVASPPMILASLQLRTVAAMDVRRRFALATYWKVRLPATGSALLAVVALVWMLRLPALSALETAMMAVLKSLEGFADVYYGLLQRNERMATIAWSCCGKGTLSFFTFAALLRATGLLWAALAGMAACHLIALALVERPACREALRSETAAFPPCPPDGKPGSDSGSARQLVRGAVPLGLVVAFISVNASMPRYFIEWRQGSAMLGCFAALGSLALALQTAVSAVAQAAAGRLAFYHSQDRAAFFRLTGKILALAFIVGAAAAGGSRWLMPLVTLLYGPSYASQPQLLGWLMAAAALFGISSLLGTALTAAQVVWAQPALYAAAVVCSIGFCRIFIWPGHPAAGAQALVISAAVLAIGQAALLHRTLGPRRASS
jgi:O-antigen/teichoic acid export membrane protein